jgi:hypothetical protein
MLLYGMGYSWQTKVYFSPRRPWPPDATQSLFAALHAIGFAFSEPRVVAQYISPTGWPAKSISDESALIEFIDQQQGGSVSLYHSSLDFHGLLSLSPSSEGFPMLGWAEAAYGYAGLHLDTNEMLTPDHTLKHKAFEAAFRASHALARVTNALYGVGDLINSRLDDLYVLREDLDERRLPRIAWWNYFDADYVSRLGENRFHGGGAWLSYQDDLGLTYITRPPRGLLHAPDALNFPSPESPTVP